MQTAPHAVATRSVRSMSAYAEPAALFALAQFAVEAARDAGFDELSQQRIELVMDEACSNIIEHAYAGKRGCIEASASIEPGCQLTIHLIDTGDAFAPDGVPEYRAEEAATREKVGGLGLYLMRKVMDEVHFEFGVPGIGNRLTMVKRI